MELLGTAEPGFQARSTSGGTETLTYVGSDTPKLFHARQAHVTERVALYETAVIYVHR
jgi:hypothetical protein